MSRIANTRKEDTHERIVAVASCAIRKRGYAGVGVADVMKEAGLTHGGFYSHFDSRDALLVKALERAAAESAEAVRQTAERRARRGVSAFRSLVETYLADSLLASMDAGCPVAALCSDMPRQPVVVREASTMQVRQLIEAVRGSLSSSADVSDAAVTVTATLVGALQLARALGNNAEGRAALAQTRRSLLHRFDTKSAAAPLTT